MRARHKYASLGQALSASGQDRITLTFFEIETLLGEPLPRSARNRRDWWANRKKASQAAAWMEAGYQVYGLNLAEQRVTFKKQAQGYLIRREGENIAWDGETIKALRLHMGMNQAEFAEQLGVRQQTISEWETGSYAPSRATRKYLTLVAERAGFLYGQEQSIEP